MIERWQSGLSLQTQSLGTLQSPSQSWTPLETKVYVWTCMPIWLTAKTWQKLVVQQHINKSTTECEGVAIVLSHLVFQISVLVLLIQFSLSSGPLLSWANSDYCCLIIVLFVLPCGISELWVLLCGPVPVSAMLLLTGVASISQKLFQKAEKRLLLSAV